MSKVKIEGNIFQTIDMNELRADLQDVYVKMDGHQLLAEAGKPGMVEMWGDLYDSMTLQIFIHKMKHAKQELLDEVVE